jgi:hypothetical protein
MLTLAVQPVPLEMDKDEVFRVSGSRVTLDTIIAAFQLPTRLLARGNA